MESIYYFQGFLFVVILILALKAWSRGWSWMISFLPVLIGVLTVYISFCVIYGTDKFTKFILMPLMILWIEILVILIIVVMIIKPPKQKEAVSNLSETDNSEDGCECYDTKE